MVIQTNVASLCAYREYTKTARAMAKNMEKLSSGYRINRSADDASGLCVSERMRAKITEFDRCKRNAQEGINLAKTADGALAEINDMLRRARYLCVQAGNGTYSEQELASISDEMNELFTEVDRITEGSFFNKIQLFRGKVEPDFHYEYDETFTPVVNDPVEWGEMHFVETKSFDRARAAVPAKATFQLDDSIQFDDLSSLCGKSVTIGGRNYYFYKDSNSIPAGSTGIEVYGSVESTLGRLTNYSIYGYGYGSSSGYINKVEVDRNTRTVTLTASIRTRLETVEANGETITYNNQIDGSYANGQPLSNPSGSPTIKPVDGVDASDNRLIYGDATNERYPYQLNLIGNAGITADQVTNLTHNTLTVGSITVKLADVGIKAGDSRQTVGDKIAAAIHKQNANYTASYDDTKGLIVTVTGLNSSSPTSSSYLNIVEKVKELTPYQPPVGGSPADYKYTYDDANSWTSSALSFAIETSDRDMEKKAKVTVTLPSVSSGPVSFSAGGRTYLIFDSTKNKLTTPGYEQTEMSAYSVSQFDLSSGGDVNTFIANAVKNACPAGYTAKQEGNKIIFTADNTTVALRTPNLSGTTVKVRPRHYEFIPAKPPTKPAVPATYSQRVLNSYSNYMYQSSEVPFSLGAALDKDRLGGSGFTIGSYYKYEFVNGGSGLNAGYTDIDISGCNNFDDLLAAVKAKLPTSWDAKLDKSDTSNVKLKIVVNSNYTVTDGLLGVEGLIKGGSAQFSGGADAEHSQTAIDFSSVTSANLNDLLGQGFRINCATCEAEYINVFFCWKKSADMPESFEITDKDGKPRTILNIPVELSQVTSGGKIVESIVSQVESKLNHYTGLKVGSPPTVLLAYEKRQGDVTDPGDPSGKIYLGSVDSGVKTNFNYSVNIRKVEDYPEDGSVALKNDAVEIYVGSEPGPQIIPIHLPYLDLKTLRLSPPEVVDLNDAEQSASDWLNRVDQANLAISKARGVIGADYNRLEHTLEDLSNAHVNLTDAESRIRDTDMAEEMMDHIKLQILTQAQQGMLAQANSRPQQILQLIS